MTLHSNGPHLNENSLDGTRRWFNGLPMDFDPDYVRFFDDFLGVVFNATDDWTVIVDSSATVTVQADTIGGNCVITGQATTDNSGGSIQGNETWVPASGRFIWFETRVSLHDADDCDFEIGFAENHSTDPEALAAASNKITFYIVEGNASIIAVCEATDVPTAVDTGIDAADNTYIILGIKVIGTGTVEFYINRVLVATITTNIPTANMALSAYYRSGNNTGTHATEIDYIGAVMSR